MKDKIRPIYETLIGYLEEAPKEDSSIYHQSIWNAYQKCLEKLKTISSIDYSEEFSLTVKRTNHGGGLEYSYISSLEYRSKLNGLIRRIHAEYFNDEQVNQQGNPGLVINQNQQQSQVTQVTMWMDFQSVLDKQLYGESLKPEEKTFLEKVKKVLPTIKSISELVITLISFAKDCGLDLNQLRHLFKA